MSTGWSSEWLDFAYMDLSAAEHLLTMRPLPVEIICYHCEQAAEKFLKATLVQFDREPPKTHDLKLRLFLDWGITFDPDGYRMPERAARKISYVNRDELARNIQNRRENSPYNTEDSK